MITIDLADTYPVIEAAADLSYAVFYSPDKQGNNKLIKVFILPLSDPLLPDVYNLSFGAPTDNGDIDDTAKITHADTGKMFSTILLFAFSFLQNNPDSKIGVDGLDDARAYLYHRMFQTNRLSLSDYFITIGLDWYVRLLRNGDIETTADGLPFFKPRPELFDYSRATTDLYRYYMFYLRK